MMCLARKPYFDGKGKRIPRNAGVDVTGTGIKLGPITAVGVVVGGDGVGATVGLVAGVGVDVVGDAEGPVVGVNVGEVTETGVTETGFGTDVLTESSSTSRSLRSVASTSSSEPMVRRFFLITRRFVDITERRSTKHTAKEGKVHGGVRVRAHSWKGESTKQDLMFLLRRKK